MLEKDESFALGIRLDLFELRMRLDEKEFSERNMGEFESGIKLF